MNKPVVEKLWVYKGFRCAIVFQPHFHRCGYVAIPKANSLYGKDYPLIDIACHGGLTYADNRLYGVTSDNEWWIGFDCAHYGDAHDYKSAKEYYKNDPKTLEYIEMQEKIEEQLQIDGTVRSLNYCIAECKNIVDQIRGEE